MSSPISERELAQMVAMFRNEICSVQKDNRDGSMFKASSTSELINAYMQPSLEFVPVSELMEVFSTGLNGKLTFNKVKLILCGMLLYKSRWLHSDKGKSILDLEYDISEVLTKNYGRGFSVQNIERGYREVRRLLKELMAELKLKS